MIRKIFMFILATIFIIIVSFLAMIGYQRFKYGRSNYQFPNCGSGNICLHKP